MVPRLYEVELEDSRVILRNSDDADDAMRSVEAMYGQPAIRATQQGVIRRRCPCPYPGTCRAPDVHYAEEEPPPI